jgi:hypothetical protein
MKSVYSGRVAGVDMKMEKIKELADDEYVMSWTYYSGTYKTIGMGHNAGDKFDMKVLEISKFKDGKSVEHWGLMNPADITKINASMAMSTDSLKGIDSLKRK